MKERYNFGSISRSRAFLMGLAALWIMFYHSGIRFSAEDGSGLTHFSYIIQYYIYLLKSIGQNGVDVFLFLSAIGLYYSMCKNEDVEVFYRRRAKRILPEYLTVSIVWDLYRGNGLMTAIKNICGISFVQDGYRGNWFFILLLFLYLVYPVLFQLSKKHGKKVFLFLFLASLLLNISVSVVFPETFDHIEIALRRIPIFLIGCWFSDLVRDKRPGGSLLLWMSIWLIVLVLTFVYITKDDSYVNVFYRYICGANALSVIFLVSSVYDLIPRVLCSVFEKCGVYSLEYYLLYEKILYVLRTFTWSLEIKALVGALICFILSYLIKKGFARIIS